MIYRDYDYCYLSDRFKPSVRQGFATSQTPARQTLQNLIEKVKPTLEHVDQVIDALRNNDGSEALELFKITQSLPASED
jgi:hypothetical protein